ncbi:DUF1289 domain-containing protein [Aureimonas frigidaquae]|uniref:DUF1289 domain-containing protein n=1 Tax=Aureimonas frigidaquae TaxID=424757 RepID=UPI0009F8B7FE|nr:DUF1289 domain-containing protein [Aureimonas frigidaquae]
MESPCRNICHIDSRTGLCVGCHRTLAEIASWASMAAQDRQAVMAALPARQQEADKPLDTIHQQNSRKIFTMDII